MDQIKTLLAKLVKLQFWIITGAAVLLAVAGYFLASSQIGQLYEAQKEALDKNFGDIQTVSAAIPTHPNAASQQKMSEIINSLSEDVRNAWAAQYERQAQFLQWPKAINNPSLVNKIQKYYPIEIKLTFPEVPREISKVELQSYAIYFDEQMPRLGQLIGVDWIGKANKAAAGGMGGMMGGPGGMMPGGDYGGGSYGADAGMGGGMMDGGMMAGGMMAGGMMGGAGGAGMMGGGMPGFANKPPDLVTWAKPSQDELITDIRMWSGDSPTVYEVYYTQENMWILEGILNIIRKTNGNAIANFQCAIKEIKFLRIGQAAVGKAGTIDMLESPKGVAGGGMDDMMGGMMDGMMGADPMGGGAMSADAMGGMGGDGYDMGGMGDMGDMGGGGFAGATVDPANRRYVDAQFEPVSGEDLRSKMQSADPSDAYFAVAKRVPVRMRLKIDQRKTQEFLANCGNADLMFEVSQVRLGDTPPAPIGGSGGGIAGGGMMGGMMMGAGMMDGGMMPGGGYGGGYGGGGMGGGEMMGMGGGEMMGMGGGMMGMGGGMMGSGMMGAAERDPWDLDIEVYGVVYLFNPVDIDRLGVEKVTEETELEVTVEPTEEVQQPVPVAPVTPPGGGGGGAPTDAGNVAPNNNMAPDGVTPTTPSDAAAAGGQPGVPQAGPNANAVPNAGPNANVGPAGGAAAGPQQPVEPTPGPNQ